MEPTTIVTKLLGLPITTHFQPQYHLQLPDHPILPLHLHLITTIGRSQIPTSDTSEVQRITSIQDRDHHLTYSLLRQIIISNQDYTRHLLLLYLPIT
jgi:hypothetical protein